MSAWRAIRTSPSSARRSSIAAGQAGYFHSGGDTVVMVDADGGDKANMFIVLTGEITLTASDFVL